jgi:anti-sigma regulatory factor (Ser/Thr protein kinase)
MVVTAAAPGYQFRHLALFYRGRGEYLTAVGDFIRASRARGHAVFAAVPGRQTEHLRRELGDDSKQVALADMAELGRNPARIIPEVLTFAQAHPGQPVSCVGEPIWPGRTTAEIEEALRHEALVNLAFRDRPVTWLCPYDSVRLPPWVVADSASTHPSIVTDLREAASADYLSPPGLPARCEQPLPPPPAHAEALDYRDDLRAVRGFVASRAEQAGLDSSRLADLVLAVSELAANTLRYTDSAGTVQIWPAGPDLICQVTDGGQITDPLARHRPRSQVLGGKGLWLVNQVCDLVQARTSPAGTVARLHMRLSQSADRLHLSPEQSPAEWLM